MIYHGLIKWRFLGDDENHFSSFSIERPEGFTYTMTLIQFKQEFVKKLKEQVGDCDIDIVYCDIKTGNKITIYS